MKSFMGILADVIFIATFQQRSQQIDRDLCDRSRPRG